MGSVRAGHQGPVRVSFRRRRQEDADTVAVVGRIEDLVVGEVRAAREAQVCALLPTPTPTPTPTHTSLSAARAGEHRLGRPS